MKEFSIEIKYFRSLVLSSLLMTHVKQLFPLRSIQHSRTFGVPLKLYVLQSPVYTRREVSSSLSIPHCVILKSYQYEGIGLNKKITHRSCFSDLMVRAASSKEKNLSIIGCRATVMKSLPI